MWDELKMMYSVTAQSLMVHRDAESKVKQVAAGAALFALKLCRQYDLDVQACSLEMAYWLRALAANPDIINTLEQVEAPTDKGKSAAVKQNGMDYTSREVIHKVIDPLFLNELKAELAFIKEESDPIIRLERLSEYRRKLAGLKFFDPAAGCGNFLVETYISVRELEAASWRKKDLKRCISALSTVMTVGRVKILLGCMRRCLCTSE